MIYIKAQFVEKVLKIECDIKKWGKVRKFLIEFLKNLEIDRSIANIIEKNINKYILPCEEIYINICKYAYPAGTGNVYIKCGYVPSCKEIFFEFIDSGEEFDPTGLNRRRLNLPLETVKAGGMGILLSEKLSDSMKYMRINDKNILKISNYVKEC